LLAPRPISKLEDHTLSAVRDCLFNTFAATLHTGGRSSIRNLRTHHLVFWDLTPCNWYIRAAVSGESASSFCRVLLIHEYWNLDTHFRGKKVKVSLYTLSRRVGRVELQLQVSLSSALTPVTYVAVCWVCSRGGLDGFWRRKSVSPAGIRISDLPACSLVATPSTRSRPLPFP